MLKQLTFKNWRSLKAVEIDQLKPITVFIGANSSGKTNILDALHFIRHAITKGSTSAVRAWRGRENIRTVGVGDEEPVLLQLSLEVEGSLVTLTDKMKFNGRDVPNLTGSHWTVDSQVVMDFPSNEDLISVDAKGIFISEEYERTLQKVETARSLIARGQMLRENFIPPLSLPADSLEKQDLYVVDPLAYNVPYILDFMRDAYPNVYSQLQTDLRRLLGHVEKVETVSDERETRIFIQERSLRGREAPTISSGTARIVAIMTAYYALDLRASEQPGLVVIEEPDTAIHPLLLGNLMDLLRSYTKRQEPRQFILTTHNPTLLNYFEPEEVRVVERDNLTGETHVDMIPDDIREIWLSKHSLGDAWMSRLMGGIPQE